MAPNPDALKPDSPVDFAELFRTLAAGEHLSGRQARAAADAMLTGAASEAQMAGLLIGLRTKGETATELAGLLDGLRAAALDVGVDAEAMGLIDTCGTGGDGSGSLNISTMAALVAAGAGARVCKHGNRAVSSSCGSADLLEALGVVVDLGPAGVAACLREAGIAFCLAPLFHPALRHAGPTRRSLGVPTAFNYLGPMANPAGVRRQVIGVNDPAMAERMAEVLAVTGTQRAMVVHGYPRLDELSTVGPTRVIELREGRIERYTVTPAELGLATVELADLAGEDVATGVAATQALLAGESVPWREIVCLNAAAGLVVGDMAADLPEGLRLAAAALDSGTAAAALARWVQASQAQAATAPSD
ncbi:MAG: anthranilate phosphoribosyltransferase [Acidimicrobiia bacterium]|nr:anthranilate phosphoribosyltransferase [Acidimicrobiia bacterium]MYE67762.1 anthranilate phosphoribosyltransferase [Acidimicrobiia bacterium]